MLVRWLVTVRGGPAMKTDPIAHAPVQQIHFVRRLSFCVICHSGTVPTVRHRSSQGHDLDRPSAGLAHGLIVGRDRDAEVT